MGRNDLATTHPDLAKEWHPTKNAPLTPQQIITGMGKKIWWKCSKCGYEWSATIVHRKFSHSGCPKCSAKKRGQYKKVNKKLKRGKQLEFNFMRDEES